MKPKYVWPHATIEVGESATFDVADYGCESIREYKYWRLRSYANYHDKAFSMEKVECPPGQLMVKITRTR